MNWKKAEVEQNNLMRKRINPVNLDTISQEWDIVGPARQVAIDSGKDISLSRVTGPCIIENLREVKHNHIIDVGCGTGFLSSKLATIADECWGIDSSKESIKLASRKYKKDNLHFVCSSIKEYKSDISFDACIANMVFMDDPEWTDSLDNIIILLSPDGKLLMTITHPCFWPQYWGYQDENWFNYLEEIFIQGSFSITLEKNIGTTTHIHRPLSKYISVLLSRGLVIEKLIELQSSTDSTPSGINFPRFIFIQAGKIM